MPNEISRVPIRFETEDIKFDGELRAVLAPRTVSRIISVLPLTGRIHRWKGEIYFSVNVKMGAEKAKRDAKAGDIAYWPQGDALCVFFEDMVPYSRINPIGRLNPQLDLKEIFSRIRQGAVIRVTLL